MNALTAVLITVGVIAVAAALGVILRSSQGRRRASDGSVFHPGDLPGLHEVASGATLVQFSTQFCTTCPSTRRLLKKLTQERDGLGYVDVDLTGDRDLATRLHILQTPTVFVLDPTGRLVTRFGGAPRLAELRSVLDDLLTPSPGVETRS